MKKKTTNKKEEQNLTSQDQLKNFLKDNKNSHYNFEESINYKVSSGSLLLDYYLDGGLGVGLHRFCGMNEGGKTSAALQFMKNFLDTKHKRVRKGFLIKAEGRLGPEIIKRSGVKFVYSAEEWKEGTCFVLESNVYETAVAAMRELVTKNTEQNEYFFILDSVDGLIRLEDLNKSFDESQKVAGGAVVAATFMKKCALALQKRGHVAIFISQVRDHINIDPYNQAPVKQTTATGGNALLHFANWILQFEPRFKNDSILQNSDGIFDLHKNPYIGHSVKLIVKKSPNEKTNSIIKYPIRYGRKNGTSNWIEKEIVDFLLGWVIEKKGPWLYFHEDIIELAKENNVENMPDKVQGAPKLEELVNKNEKAKKFFIKYIKTNILVFETDGT